MKEERAIQTPSLLPRCLTRVRALFKLKRRSNAARSPAAAVKPAVSFRLPIAEKYATTLDLSPQSSLPVYQSFLDHPEEEEQEEEEDQTVTLTLPSPSSPSGSSFVSRISTLWSRPTSPTISSARTLSISYPLTRPSTSDQSLIQKPILYTFPVLHRDSLLSNADSGVALDTPRIRPKKNNSFSFSAAVNFRDSWFSMLTGGDDDEDIRRRSRSLSLTLSIATRARVDSMPLERARVDSIPLSLLAPRDRLNSSASTQTASSVYSHVSIIDAVNSRNARLMLVKSIEAMFDKNGRERPDGLGIDEIPPVPPLPRIL